MTERWVRVIVVIAGVGIAGMVAGFRMAWALQRRYSYYDEMEWWRLRSDLKWWWRRRTGWHKRHPTDSSQIHGASLPNFLDELYRTSPMAAPFIKGISEEGIFPWSDGDVVTAEWLGTIDGEEEPPLQ